VGTIGPCAAAVRQPSTSSIGTVINKNSTLIALPART
jgi:hypothetical protein